MKIELTEILFVIGNVIGWPALWSSIKIMWKKFWHKEEDRYDIF